MSRIKLPFFFICFGIALLASCQKIEFDDEEKKDSPKTEVKDEEDNTEENDDDDTSTSGRRSKYTVMQFLEEAPSFQVWVEGYIIGECKQKIGNARFAPPFSYNTAILMADDFSKTNKGEYIPVCLKSGSSARKKLNLKDNPSMYHKKIKIYALREKYFGVTGIKEIDDFEILE